jgi:hypothetical protein
MAQIRVATLCDHVEVREGLLTIVSAGVTRLWRDQLPSPLAVALALQVEFSPQERRFPHEVAVNVRGPSGAEVVEFRAALQMADRGDFDPDEGALANLPIDIRPAMLQEYGWHEIAISVDSGDPLVLRIKVARRPTRSVAPGVRIAPPSKRTH